MYCIVLKAVGWEVWNANFLIEARLRPKNLFRNVFFFRFIRILWFGELVTLDLQQVVSLSVSHLQCERPDRSSEGQHKAG